MPVLPYLLIEATPGYVVWGPPFYGDTRTLVWVRNSPDEPWVADMVLQSGDHEDYPDFEDGAECKIAADPDFTGQPVTDLSNTVILHSS